MFGNNLQETTSADDIFRCFFFLGALRVNLLPANQYSYVQKLTSAAYNVAAYIQMECIQTTFSHRSQHYEPGQTDPKGAVLSGSILFTI